MKGFAARFSMVAGLLVVLILSLAGSASAPDGDLLDRIDDQRPSPVGGEVVAVKPLAILAPYLLVIVGVAIFLLAIWKNLLAGKTRLEPLTL